MSPVSGIALLRKPAGLSSFDALGPVKRRLGTGKVGHSGTLDRFASGLLVLLVGSHSRLVPYFTALDKLYVARLRLGEETDTLDPEGQVLARAEPCSRAAFEAVLPSFRGPILQRPPAFSALHIAGQRAHERARRGESLEMPERPVRISELELLDFAGNETVIRVRCSSGTYIRSLARDLALAAGSRAYLLELERLEVGPFRLEEAVEAAELEPGRDLRSLDPGLAAALGLRPRRISDGALRRFLNGGRIGAEDLSGELKAGEGPASGLRAVFAPGGDFLGVLEESGGEFSYRFVVGGAS